MALNVSDTKSVLSKTSAIEKSKIVIRIVETFVLRNWNEREFFGKVDVIKGIKKYEPSFSKLSIPNEKLRSRYAA